MGGAHLHLRGVDRSYAAIVERHLEPRIWKRPADLVREFEIEPRFLGPRSESGQQLAELLRPLFDEIVRLSQRNAELSATARERADKGRDETIFSLMVLAEAYARVSPKPATTNAHCTLVARELGISRHVVRRALPAFIRFRPKGAKFPPLDDVSWWRLLAETPRRPLLRYAREHPRRFPPGSITRLQELMQQSGVGPEAPHLRLVSNNP